MTAAAPLHRFIATGPQGVSDLLARELGALGALQAAVLPAAVRFEGPLEVGYRACLWSRTASRLLLQLNEFEARTADELYSRLREVEWEVHIDARGTIACAFSGSHPSITNAHFGALRVKDAICDRLREVAGARPDVSLAQPDVRIQIHARATQVGVFLDMAGEGLHRRGYRREGGSAPLRENVAAAILLRSRWPEAAAEGAEFLDPLCGSGTLVIEAAMIACQRAPGLMRRYWGFLGWRGHDRALWERLCEEARAAGLPRTGAVLRGSDIDRAVLAQATANAERAGVAERVRFEPCAVSAVRPMGQGSGLACTNPPYGDRLGDIASAQQVHRELGEALRAHFAGWQAAILTSATGELARELRLRSYRVHALWNGAIPCRLLRIDLSAPGAPDLRSAHAQLAEEGAASPAAQMFANRLGKNQKHLQRAARRLEISCYRVYDADMPEYAFAIDRYVDDDSGAVHWYVQEYAAPPTINAADAQRRRREALGVMPRALSTDSEHLHLRLRQRQRAGHQYTARRERGASPAAAPLAASSLEHSLCVREGGLRFWVNLDDYLDTGLFLDHRPTRALVRELAAGRRFLNLCCYSASASVYAAAGGATASLSIDLSPRYLQWAADNFRLNGLDPAQHRLLQGDCRRWLQDATAALQRGGAERFDLIFFDPPTFSNSKRMQGVLDIQRDHPELIDACMQLLAPQGILLFSTHAQRFRLAMQVEQRYRVEDLSQATLPFDFVRQPRIHCCFRIRADDAAIARPSQPERAAPAPAVVPPAPGRGPAARSDAPAAPVVPRRPHRRPR